MPNAQTTPLAAIPTSEMPKRGEEYSLDQILVEIKDADEDRESAENRIRSAERDLERARAALEEAQVDEKEHGERRRAWAMEMMYTLGQATRPVEYEDDDK